MYLSIKINKKEKVKIKSINYFISKELHEINENNNKKVGQPLTQATRIFSYFPNTCIKNLY